MELEMYLQASTSQRYKERTLIVSQGKKSARGTEMGCDVRYYAGETVAEVEETIDGTVIREMVFGVYLDFSSPHAGTMRRRRKKLLP